MWKLLWIAIFSFSASAQDLLPRNAAPADASVYIITPVDGEKVKGDIVVRFGLRGMGIAPAGVNMTGTGHHHLLIDVEKLPAMDLPLPKDDRHLHFGAGQTETTIKLSPGKHTLQLVLGDQLHIPHQPPVISKKITITVTE